MEATAAAGRPATSVGDSAFETSSMQFDEALYGPFLQEKLRHNLPLFEDIIPVHVMDSLEVVLYIL